MDESCSSPRAPGGDLIWEAVLSRGQGEAAAATVVVAAASLTG